MNTVENKRMLWDLVCEMNLFRPEFKKEEISLALDAFIFYLQKSSNPKIDHIIKNIEKIQKEIKTIDPIVNLDFKATYFDSNNSGYSGNYFTYDGDFKLCNNIYPKYNFANDLWLNLTKKKICIFLNTSPIGRKLNLEDKLKNNNWKLFYRYSIKDPYLIE